MSELFSFPNVIQRVELARLFFTTTQERQTRYEWENIHITRIRPKNGVLHRAAWTEIQVESVANETKWLLTWRDVTVAPCFHMSRGLHMGHGGCGVGVITTQRLPSWPPEKLALRKGGGEASQTAVTEHKCLDGPEAADDQWGWTRYTLGSRRELNIGSFESSFRPPDGNCA